MSVIVPLLCVNLLITCDFSVFTHYGDYNENHLLLSVGIRWWFGCHSVFHFLPGLIQGSSLLSKGQVAPVIASHFLYVHMHYFVLLLMFIIHLSYQEST